MTRVSALVLMLAFAVACTQSPAKEETPPAKTEPAPAAEKKGEHTFRGKVEAVDAAAKTLSVNGENVDGWMMAMTMTYSASNPDILPKVKVGDQITAKVYDGDFATLHDVQIVK